MKKFLGLILAFCVLISASIVFSACSIWGGGNFAVNENNITAADQIISNLVQKVYKSNLQSSTTFSVSEIEELVEDFNYYVDAGTIEGEEEVNSIVLNGTTFEKDDEFYLSVGSNRFIKDKAYFVEENKLFIAAPILAFESVNNGRIKINDIDNDFASVNAQEGKFKELSFVGNGNTVSEGAMEGGYDLTITNSNNSYLELFYDGAKETDVVLTKKNDGEKVSYGITDVEQKEGNPLAYYPIGWSESITQSQIDYYNEKTIEYSAYIVGEEKVLTAKLNIIVETAE